MNPVTLARLNGHSTQACRKDTRGGSCIPIPENVVVAWNHESSGPKARAFSQSSYVTRAASMYLAIWRLSGVDGVSRIESVAAGRMTERLRFNRYTSQKIPQTPALPAFSPPPPDEAEPCGHATDSEHAHGRRLRDGGNREGDGVPGRMLDLSGARSSGTEPSILMGDEPTGNLDSRTGADVIALLRKLNVDRSLTVVLVTHDQQVARHADRTIVLRDGLIVADTTSFAEAKAALEADQPAAEPRS